MPFIKGYCETARDLELLWAQISPIFNEIKCQSLKNSGKKIYYNLWGFCKGETWLFVNPLRVIRLFNRLDASSGPEYLDYSGLLRRIYADSSTYETNAHVNDYFGIYSTTREIDTNTIVWERRYKYNFPKHFVFDGVYVASYIPKTLKNGDIVEIEGRKCVVFRPADNNNAACAISID